jgi:hypothetical protein
MKGALPVQIGINRDGRRLSQPGPGRAPRRDGGCHLFVSGEAAVATGTSPERCARPPPDRGHQATQPVAFLQRMHASSPCVRGRPLGSCGRHVRSDVHRYLRPRPVRRLWREARRLRVKGIQRGWRRNRCTQRKEEVDAQSHCALPNVTTRSRAEHRSSVPSPDRAQSHARSSGDGDRSIASGRSRSVRRRSATEANPLSRDSSLPPDDRQEHLPAGG